MQSKQWRVTWQNPRQVEQSRIFDDEPTADRFAKNKVECGPAIWATYEETGMNQHPTAGRRF